MTAPRRAKITAVGSYVPPKVVTNDDLAKIVETTNEWILERTGIRERHVVEKGVAASDLGARAAEAVLRQRGIDASEIDLIIVVTVTPDMFFPATACLVQNKIGARNAWGFDLSAACSGFLYGVTVGAQFIAQFDVIVDLSVEDDPAFAVHRLHRLMAARREIEDREAAMAKDDVARDIVSRAP